VNTKNRFSAGLTGASLSAIGHESERAAGRAHAPVVQSYPRPGSPAREAFSLLHDEVCREVLREAFPIDINDLRGRY
jgi:hypothetical protein